MPWLSHSPLPRDFSAVTVIDLEATCYENGDFPPGEVQEIIEIGVCVLDLQSGEPGDRDSILVRPERSRVSPFCTALTGITPEQADTGTTLRDACRVLWSRYKAGHRPWASWGAWDAQMLRADCERKGIRYPVSETHIDISPLFALAWRQQRLVSVTAALELLGLPAQGTAHRAADDAWNAARVLARLLNCGRC